MTGDQDLIRTALCNFQRTASVCHDKWIIDTVVCEIILQLFPYVPVSKSTLNRSTTKRGFRMICDDSVVNEYNIYKRKYSKKWYYYFSSTNCIPPAATRGWSALPSVISLLPSSILLPRIRSNTSHTSEIQSSLGKTRANPANQVINPTTPNNKRNNNDMTPAHTHPALAVISPDDVVNESVFQSPEAFSMFLGVKKQMRISILM